MPTINLKTVSGANVLTLTPAQEEQILSNPKLMETPIQMSDLKTIFANATKQEMDKTRHAYQKEIDTLIDADTLKWETIEELAKKLTTIKTFGTNLKKLAIFGFQAKGKGKNNSNLLLIVEKEAKKQTK